MARPYAIWGSAGHAKVLASIVASQGDQVVALFDNQDVPSILPGVPVYLREEGFHRWLQETPSPSETVGLVAIGGHAGSCRIEIQDLFLSAGMRLESLIHPTAFVCNTATLGEGTQVLAQAVVAAGSRLGRACIVNHKASVDHECHLGDGVHVAPGATLCGCIIIEDNVMVGAGAVILPRVTIGRDTIIGGGAVVTKDVPAGSIVTGNPGRCR